MYITPQLFKIYIYGGWNISLQDMLSHPNSQGSNCSSYLPVLAISKTQTSCPSIKRMHIMSIDILQTYRTTVLGTIPP